MNNTSNKSLPKAAACIIGNEILSGKILDTNTNYLAKKLFTYGIDLIEIRVIPDIKHVIIDTIRVLSQNVGSDGYVFTSGGIGPTHDDITYDAIAAAFNKSIILHQPTVDRMVPYLQKRGVDFNDARKRMALIPEPTSIIWTDSLWVPIVNVHNVYLFPGIPSLFEKMMDSMFEQVSGLHGHQPVKRMEIMIDGIGEGDFGDTLRNIAAQYTDVEIGSYPIDPGKQNFNINDPNASADKYRPRVVLTLQSRNYDRLEQAVTQCQQEIGGTLKTADTK